MTTNVLILCTHNSARSLLGEGMLNHLASQLGTDVRAYSAGSAPSGKPNPFAIAVLQGAGVDTSTLRSKSWDEFTRPESPAMHVVITVCDSAAAEACPFWTGSPVKTHWGYPDPSSTVGSDDAKRRAFELTRQALAYRLILLLQLRFEALDNAALQLALGKIGRS